MEAQHAAVQPECDTCKAAEWQRRCGAHAGALLGVDTHEVHGAGTLLANVIVADGPILTTGVETVRV